MKQFGLIGYPLGHSFSKKYFTEKFEALNLHDHSYELFEIDNINKFEGLWKTQPDLVGVNVTVPYKEKVQPFLDDFDESAERVGAVNVVFKRDSKLTGYNTDYYGFKSSVENWIGSFSGKALVLGTGGSSRAVRAALQSLNIDVTLVSRQSSRATCTYSELYEKPELLQAHQLVVNTSPAGMYPHIDDCPDIPYERLTSDHFLFDLVYNPEETKFMREGARQGAKTKNGLEMLHLQAEKSWEIWNS